MYILSSLPLNSQPKQKRYLQTITEVAVATIGEITTEEVVVMATETTMVRKSCSVVTIVWVRVVNMATGY